MEFQSAQNSSTFIIHIHWNHELEKQENGYTCPNFEWDSVDTTKHHFPSAIWITKPGWEVALKVVSMLPIVIIGGLANGGLIHVILKTKSLHTTTNLLTVNMSIADLITCTVCPWMFLCVDLYQNYIMGPVGCRLDGLLVHSLTLVAVFNLSAISYDRLSAIALNCSGKLTEKTTYVLICTTWLVGGLVATPLSVFRKYYERKWKDYLETYCTEDTILVYPYWHIFAGLSMWSPLAIMAICYCSILIKLDRYQRQAVQSKHPVIVKYKGRVARILALIVVAFIICRVPFTALIIRRGQLLQQPPRAGQAESLYHLWYISRYLVLVNAAINPLLYGCSSSTLKKELVISSFTSWLIPKKRRKARKPCIISQYQLNNFRRLESRSPCVDANYNQRSDIPNISSQISPVIVNVSPT